MADVCDYVYVSGLRFKSGDPYVEIPTGYLEALTGKTPQDPRALVRLSVVRDGKGASRTERWADKPARFGVTGEINLRDLGVILEKQGLQDIDAQVPLLIDGNQEVVPLVLNPSAGMGRRGRLIDPEAIEDLLMSLPDGTVQELIKDQLRNMPYGLENSKAAAVRLGVLLQHATDDTITDVVSSGSSDFVKHMDRDTIQNMGTWKAEKLLIHIKSSTERTPEGSEAEGMLAARLFEHRMREAADGGVAIEAFLANTRVGSARGYLDEQFLLEVALQMLDGDRRESGTSHVSTKNLFDAGIFTERSSMECLFSSGMLEFEDPYEAEELLREYFAGDRAALERIFENNKDAEWYWVVQDLVTESEETDKDEQSIGDEPGTSTSRGMRGEGPGNKGPHDIRRARREAEMELDAYMEELSRAMDSQSGSPD